MIGDRVTDLLVDETDLLFDYVRAHLSDHSRTAAAVLAFAALSNHLSPPDLAIARAALSAGVDHCSVKHIAALAGQHRSSPTRRLHKESDYTVNDITQLARPTVAVVLKRRTRLTIDEIRRCLGYSKPKYVDMLIRRVFGQTISDIVHDDTTEDIVPWPSDRFTKSGVKTAAG